jgi:hypothetical protein
MSDFLKSKPEEAPKLMKTARFLLTWTDKQQRWNPGNAHLLRPDFVPKVEGHYELVPIPVKHFEWVEARRLDSTRYIVVHLHDDGKGVEELRFKNPKGEAIFSKDEAIAKLLSEENGTLGSVLGFTLVETPEQTPEHFSRYVTQGAQPTRPNGESDTPKGPEPT